MNLLYWFYEENRSMTKLQQRKISDLKKEIKRLERMLRESDQIRNSVARELFKIAK
jgi:predicted RNase H-like nuclease (RuvC/YqgF family)